MCWRVLPSRLRRRLIGAWRNRVNDPVAHREALVEVLAWCRDWNARVVSDA
jgi:hypothetical protein